MFGCGAGAAAGFVHGYAAAADFVTGGKETLTCVAFSEEGVVFFAELVPEVVEGFVVWAVDDVAESMEESQVGLYALWGESFLLVEHGIGDPFQGHELAFVTSVSEAQTDVLTCIDI